MVVIIYTVEGIDCSGKSTLIKMLSESLGLPVVKGSSFELSKKSNQDLFNYFFKLTEQDNIIIDRFIPSNLVYASLYKDYAILSWEQVRQLEDRIRGRSKNIYLYADLNTIKSRLIARGDNYVNVDMLEKIMCRYDEVIDKSNLILQYINTTNKSPEEVLNEVVHVK